MKKKQYTTVTFIKALLLTIVLGLLAYIIDVPAIRISLIGMTLVLGAISHGMMSQLQEAGLDDMKDHIDKNKRPSHRHSEGFCFLQKCKVVVREIDSCIVVFWINYGCKVKGKHILGKLSFRHSICEKE